jgi:transcriptional regulator with XRE-family HTH domain
MIQDLDLSKSFIQNLTKRGSKPSIETMEKIADYLGVSIDYLVGKDGNEINIYNQRSEIKMQNIECKKVCTDSKDLTLIEMALLQKLQKLSEYDQIKLLEALSQTDEERKQ